MNSSACRYLGLLILSLVVLALASPVTAQEPQSVGAAKQLIGLLEQGKLDSIAAKDPSANDAYVAALYFPGQLMVVSARYSVPVLLNDKLSKKEYRDIYNDLNGAPVAGTRVLVMDLGADGLKPKRDENKAFDTFESGAKTWLFDGDWKTRKLTEEEYMKAFTDADARYTRMLQALVGQAKKGTTLP